MAKIDLLDYVCPPNGKAYMLSSNELCQSVLRPDGWIEFRKNQLYEEFWADASVIYRGADTSDLWREGNQYTGTYYIQYKDDVYGCPWVARFMDKGEVYSKRCRVIKKHYDGTLISDGFSDDTLLLRNILSTFVTPQGKILSNVIELLWGANELYYYGKGYGLVGWRNLQTTTLGNFFTGEITAPSMQPVYPPDKRSPRPAPPAVVPPIIPVPPPTNPPIPPLNSMEIAAAEAAKDYGPVIKYRILTTVAETVNVRALPTISSNKILASLKKGDIIECHEQTTIMIDGFNWLKILKNNGVAIPEGGIGWSARSVMTLEKYVEPVNTVTKLIPFVYVSQLGGDANLRNNDCSVAVAASAALTRLKKLGYGAMPLLTVNNLIQFTPLKSGDGLVSMDALESLMRLLNVPYSYSDALTPDNIAGHIQAGYGCLMLMNYNCLNPAYRFGHFAIVVGTAQNNAFVVNDPYLMGEGYQISKARLQAGLTSLKNDKGEAFANKPYQGYILR